MKDCDLKSMSVDELWTLHEETVAALARKIIAEKARLEQRLHELGQVNGQGAKKLSHARRPYPQVFPKYRNPAEPAETWAGRGKQPRWLAAQLRSGKKLDDFRIQPASHRPGAAPDRRLRYRPQGIIIPVLIQKETLSAAPKSQGASWPIASRAYAPNRLGLPAITKS